MSLYTVYNLKFLNTFGINVIHGTFSSFEEACESCFKLELINGLIPPHVKIIETKIDKIAEPIHVLCFSKYIKEHNYSIVNLHEKCIFSSDRKLIYGNMSNDNFLKYISVLETKECYEINKLLGYDKKFNQSNFIKRERIGNFIAYSDGWNPYYDYFRYNSNSSLLNSDGFIFSLSLEQIKELYNEIIKIQNKPKTFFQKLLKC
jgi:hypothetical protein